MTDQPESRKDATTSHEERRMQALREYRVLDTAAETAFDELVELASQIAGAPMSLISLIDEDRQWFKARKGLQVTETSRAVAFCAHAIQQDEILEISDATTDPRFSDNPLVTGAPDLRFYAGVPLVTPHGFALGTLCVLDDVPHPPLSDQQRRALQIIARQVMAQLELRRMLAGKQVTQNELTRENEFLQEKVIEQTGELRVNAEVLRQSQKMEALGQLTGGIAHDFNNLLQGIVGSIAASRQLIARNRPAEVDRFLVMASGSAQRAAGLTSRLLAFARNQPMEPETINVQRQLQTLLEVMRRICGESIQLTVEDDEQLWLTRCDPNQLENAILNLVINARDAMKDSGHLTIRFSNALIADTAAASGRLRPPEFVAIAVSDTGTGMAPDTVKRAFDAFFTTKPAGQGTGLGLSMVAGFARQAGGFARINSEIGHGTTVEIFLPRSDRSLEAPTSQPYSPDSADLLNLSIAVVEDDSIVRNLIVGMLQEAGCHVFEASDGASGLRALESAERIDLLIADVGLPGLNGRHLANVAKAIRPTLKVLLISGHGADTTQRQDGTEAVLSKPFPMEEFIRRVRELAGREIEKSL